MKEQLLWLNMFLSEWLGYLYISMIRTRNRTVYLKPKNPNFDSTIKDYIDHPQRVYTNDTAVLNKENGFSEVQISMLVTKKVNEVT